MTGEALTTHRSATPEILFQIGDAHLHRGNVVFIEQFEKRPAFETQEGGRLTLGKAALFKPTQHSRHQKFAAKFHFRFTQELKCILRNFDGHT